MITRRVTVCGLSVGLPAGARVRRAALATSVVVSASAFASCVGSRSDAQIALVVAHAQQAAADVSYLPVEVGGRWVLSGPEGVWRQSEISTRSAPWHWNAARCTVLNASLVPGMRTFMHRELTALFTRPLAASLESRLLHKVQISTKSRCVKNNPTLTVGPPGPILERTRVSKVDVTGMNATVTARVTVTDWQGGVTDRVTSASGRAVGWAVVHGQLDARYVLDRDASGQWKVSSYRSTFAPGSEP